MKDIYELLNEIDIDENEFEEIEVSEFEKAQIKSKLKKTIRQRKKMNGWKMKLAVATAIAGLSVATIGLTFPAYAGNIPVIGDIFRFLDNGRTGLYENYKEYATEMNITRESKGIKITINDAIFDGKTVSLTYSIESDQDLGDQPILHDFLDIVGANAMSGSSQISKVTEHHYVGLITASNLDHKGKNTAKVKWAINSIAIPSQQEEVKGSWNFALTLEATDSKVQLSDHSSEHAGVKVKIDRISITPMSFIVYYDQVISGQVRDKWHAADIDLDIKDDFGNHYSGEGNGGSGDGYDMSSSKTFEKLDPNATKLIITPQIRLYEHTSDNYGSVELTKDGPKEIPIPKKPGKGEEEFMLEDIVIELE